MKANLTIADRFAILGILPSGGNFATLKIIRKLREQLSLTEVEIKEHKVEQIDNDLTWINANKTTEMNFSDFHTEMIQNALKSMNDEKKLDERHHYSIYEQFVGE